MPKFSRVDGPDASSLLVSPSAAVAPPAAAPPAMPKASPRAPEPLPAEPPPAPPVDVPLPAPDAVPVDAQPAAQVGVTPGRSVWEAGTSRPTSLRRDAIFRRSLVAADVLATVIALVAAVELSGSPLSLRLGALVTLPGVVLIAKLLRLYDRDELVFHKATLDEAPSLLYLSALLALGVWFGHDLVLRGYVGRPAIAILWGSFTLTVLVTRSLARAICKRRAPWERCVVAGPAGARRRLAEKIFASQIGVDVVGYLPLEDERQQDDRRSAPRAPGADRRVRRVSIDDLPAVTREIDVHRLVIVPGGADSATMARAISRANRAGLKVSILPRMFETVGSSVEFDEFEGLTVLGVRRFGLSRSSQALKRAMDIVISSVALIVGAPLFALIALAIRLDSPGPVLFRQMRVGRADACFEMLKFRSMVDGADEMRADLIRDSGGVELFKLRRDPRVTRVGRLLRATSFDELPQLFNVLRGDMSLVGPRPLILEEDSFIEGHYRGRLELAPGMTGPWQLLGPMRVPLREMVNMDYLYGANWSLWTDVKVLLRTVAHVLGRRGV